MIKGKFIEEKFDEIYSKCLKKVQDIPEYKQNEMQISSIKNVLIREADVPESLVSWLIQSVKSNVNLEYSIAYKEFLNSLKINT